MNLILLFFTCLHHAVNAQNAINSVYRALKPGGIFIAVEPGSGHAKRAKPVMEKYGTTERDMPPSLIIKLGKLSGFSRAKVYVRLYNTPFEIMPYLSLNGLRSVVSMFFYFYRGSDR